MLTPASSSSYLPVFCLCTARHQHTNPAFSSSAGTGLVQGPEIRTGMLENGKPVQLQSGQEVTITTDYAKPGNSGLIAMRCVSTNSGTAAAAAVAAAAEEE